MTVRKTAGTTLSLIILIVGLIYLFPVIRRVLPWDLFYILGERLQYSFGGYHSFVVDAAVWIITAAVILDAILQNRVALGLFSSLNVPIIMGIPVIVAALIPPVNPYMFWAVLQVSATIGAYWMFRKIIRNNRPGGQKMIPFIKEIKTAGGIPKGHISDHYGVFGMSLLLIAVYVLLLISLIIFAATYWDAFV